MRLPREGARVGWVRREASSWLSYEDLLPLVAGRSMATLNIPLEEFDRIVRQKDEEINRLQALLDDLIGYNVALIASGLLRPSAELDRAVNYRSPVSNAK